MTEHDVSIVYGSLHIYATNLLDVVKRKDQFDIEECREPPPRHDVSIPRFKSYGEAAWISESIVEGSAAYEEDPKPFKDLVDNDHPWKTLGSLKNAAGYILDNDVDFLYPSDEIQAGIEQVCRRFSTDFFNRLEKLAMEMVDEPYETIAYQSLSKIANETIADYKPDVFHDLVIPKLLELFGNSHTRERIEDFGNIPEGVGELPLITSSGLSYLKPDDSSDEALDQLCEAFKENERAYIGVARYTQYERPDATLKEVLDDVDEAARFMRDLRSGFDLFDSFFSPDLDARNLVNAFLKQHEVGDHDNLPRNKVKSAVFEKLGLPRSLAAPEQFLTKLGRDHIAAEGFCEMVSHLNRFAGSPWCRYKKDNRQPNLDPTQKGHLGSLGRD